MSPAHAPVQYRHGIDIIVVRCLQGNDRVEEQSQRPGCFDAGVHVTLLFPVVGLGE
jgi:hypothetical protein